MLPVADMDKRFGLLLPPQVPFRGNAVQDWERDFVPESLTLLDASSALSLKKAMDDITDGWIVGKVLTFDVIIIWLVDRLGEIVFALEELVVDGQPTGRPKHQSLAVTSPLPKLGHPSLINCSSARIGGEIYFDTGMKSPAWIINNQSGRYGRHPSRKTRHLENAAKKFRDFEIFLTPRFRFN